MAAGSDRGAPSRGIRIRRAGPGDARAIAEVAVAGWRAAYRGILSDDFLDAMQVEAREAAWHEMLTRDVDGGNPAWVAELAGGVVGFVSCGPPRDEDVPLPAAEIYAIYVLARMSRQGLGRALLDTALGHCRAGGAATAVLWVFRDNAPARAFYEAMGWQPDGGRQEIELAGTSAIEVRYRIRTGA